MAIRLDFVAALVLVSAFSVTLVIPLVDAQFATSWWSLGISGCATAKGACENCAQLRERGILSPAQSEECSEDSAPIQAIAKGTRQAIVDCQKRFECNKWNCSTFFGENLFGTFVSELRTRETAVLYGYLTAGATQLVAQACREQRIADCPCVGTLPQSRDEDGNTILTACSENIEWAQDYVQDFVRRNYNLTVMDAGVQSDLHNVNVGRKSVNTQSKFCNCHGISGTCTVQTCYQKVPVVSEVGESLYTKYDGAVKVDLVNNQLERVNPQADSLTDDDLAYIDDSPNFCIADSSLGVLGTSDRLCDPSPNSVKSCSVLCCGRGFYTQTFTVPVEECAFKWCCRIECAIVRNETITEYRCNRE